MVVIKIKHEKKLNAGSEESSLEFSPLKTCSKGAKISKFFLRKLKAYLHSTYGLLYLRGFGAYGILGFLDEKEEGEGVGKVNGEVV